MSSFMQTIRVGWFLGVRQVLRANIWMNILIITIMALTFLNLVVIPGVLVGLIEGGNRANKAQYSGNVIFETLDKKDSIENTHEILETLKTIPQITNVVPRYLASVTAEANYRTRRNFIDNGNSVGASIAGVNPEDEDALTGLSGELINGEYLSSDETGYILIGDIYLEKYSQFNDIFTPLQNTDVGSRVRLTYAGPNTVVNIDPNNIGRTGDSDGGPLRTKEFIVKGVIDSKVDDVTARIFMTETDFRLLTGRVVLNAQEIAVKSDESISDDELKQKFVLSGFEQYAEINTALEAIPKFLDTIKDVMSMLGSVIGFIGIVVSAITIFVVIYINALTRRKYIGILKGVGVTRQTIWIAYIIQAVFYACIGIVLGLALIYGVLVPFINANPINFPFSDGIISAPVGGTSIRALILFTVTLTAGFIPAWLIVRQNTLDSILGR